MEEKGERKGKGGSGEGRVGGRREWGGKSVRGVKGGESRGKEEGVGREEKKGGKNPVRVECSCHMIITAVMCFVSWFTYP